MKREVSDKSGHCNSLGHVRCRAQWETPSAIVTCSCQCHATSPVASAVVKKPRGAVRKSKVIVKKKMVLARADDDV